MNISAHYRKISIFIIVILLSLSQTPIVMAESLDFPTAWQYVSERSYVLLAEQANIEHAEYQQRAGKDMHLPQINLNGGYLYLDDKIQLSPKTILESMPAGELIGTQLGGLFQGLGLSAEAINHNFTSTLSDREIKTAGLSV
ncbi:MAG: hypothetical protein KAG12_09665, partial [Desulfuromusa sp.]|nr:hypothetical protein [Desulfuromusa sp.]